MKTNFENIGGSYSQQGDYLLPTLTLPDENQMNTKLSKSDLYQRLRKMKKLSLNFKSKLLI